MSTVRVSLAHGEATAGVLPAPGRCSISTDGRVRQSRGSVDRHTSQSQPIIGTPCEVPVPRKVMRTRYGVMMRFWSPCACTKRIRSS